MLLFVIEFEWILKNLFFKIYLFYCHCLKIQVHQLRKIKYFYISDISKNFGVNIITSLYLALEQKTTVYKCVHEMKFHKVSKLSKKMPSFRRRNLVISGFEPESLAHTHKIMIFPVKKLQIPFYLFVHPNK